MAKYLHSYKSQTVGLKIFCSYLPIFVNFVLQILYSGSWSKTALLRLHMNTAWKWCSFDAVRVKLSFRSLKITASQVVTICFQSFQKELIKNTDIGMVECRTLHWAEWFKESVFLPHCLYCLILTITEMDREKELY